jgi:hypothetical protein
MVSKRETTACDLAKMGQSIIWQNNFAAIVITASQKSRLQALLTIKFKAGLNKVMYYLCLL